MRAKTIPGRECLRCGWPASFVSKSMDYAYCLEHVQMAATSSAERVILRRLTKTYGFIRLRDLSRSFLGCGDAEDIRTAVKYLADDGIINTRIDKNPAGGPPYMVCSLFDLGVVPERPKLSKDKSLESRILRVLMNHHRQLKRRELLSRVQKHHGIFQSTLDELVESGAVKVMFDQNPKGGPRYATYGVPSRSYSSLHFPSPDSMLAPRIIRLLDRRGYAVRFDDLVRAFQGSFSSGTVQATVDLLVGDGRVVCVNKDDPLGQAFFSYIPAPALANPEAPTPEQVGAV